MRKKLLASFIAVLFSLCSFAQFTEDFSDGDFTNNPAWGGGTADWIVNGSFQLQSNNTVLNSTYYLSTASTKATTAQWEFFTLITFNPSSANYVDVFLTAYERKQIPHSLVLPAVPGGYLLETVFKRTGSREGKKSRRFIRVGDLSQFQYYESVK